MAGCPRGYFIRENLRQNLAAARTKFLFFSFGELTMKYCAFCKRMNPGRPTHCQYCGRTFGVRVCHHCREANPYEALTCRNCGSAELSETSGLVPFWTYLFNIKFLIWIFAFIFIVGLIKNIDLLLSLLIIVALWSVGFSFMPQLMKKIFNKIFRYFWKFLRRKS